MHLQVQNLPVRYQLEMLLLQADQLARVSWTLSGWDVGAALTQQDAVFSESQTGIFLELAS